MNDLRPVLNKQLSQLESESQLIDEAIQEIHRRFSVLDDVESWGLNPEADEVSPAFGSSIPEVSEVIEEEELDKVNSEREEDFEFAVSGELGAE